MIILTLVQMINTFNTDLEIFSLIKELAEEREISDNYYSKNSFLPLDVNYEETLSRRRS